MPEHHRGSQRAEQGETLLRDQIRELVLRGEFSLGGSLSELSLAEQFQVSRTPVREALKQLEIEGLLEIRPRVGTFVRVPTRREIVELFQIKESLEGLAAGLLARRGAVPQVAELRENIERSRWAVTRSDSHRYAELVHDFHETLVAAADNTKLVEHYDRLMNQLAYQRIVMSSIELPGRMAESLAEHEAVVLAVEAKDAALAERSMRHHVVASGEAASFADRYESATAG